MPPKESPITQTTNAMGMAPTEPRPTLVPTPSFNSAPEKYKTHSNKTKVPTISLKIFLNTFGIAGAVQKTERFKLPSSVASK